VQLSVSARSSNLVLIRFIILEILRFLYFAVLAWNCLSRPFLGDFWGIFPPNMVAHRYNPQTALPYAEARRLSHKAWKSVQWFDLGAFPRKKNDRTGQSNKKSHKVVIFRPYGEKPPTVPNRTKICMVCRLPNLITYAKFQVEIFRGYDFTGGRISHFPIDFSMGLTTVQALLRCLWLTISNN